MVPVIAVALVPAAPVGAQGPDKSKYTLFVPTPRDMWRPLSADRPDITESPVTVDAGAVQVEVSFFEYAGPVTTRCGCGTWRAERTLRGSRATRVRSMRSR